jgi:hypothetical protein
MRLKFPTAGEKDNDDLLVCGAVYFSREASILWMNRYCHLQGRVELFIYREVDGSSFFLHRYLSLRFITQHSVTG